MQGLEGTAAPPGQAGEREGNVPGGGVVDVGEPGPALGEIVLASGRRLGLVDEVGRGGRGRGVLEELGQGRVLEGTVGGGVPVAGGATAAGEAAVAGVFEQGTGPIRGGAGRVVHEAVQSRGTKKTTCPAYRRCRKGSARGRPRSGTQERAWRWYSPSIRCP